MQVTRADVNHSMATASLSAGAQLFVYSMREWRVALRQQYCIERRLRPFYQRYQATDAIPVLNELMQYLSVAATRTPQIFCPCKPLLTSDELALLNSLRSLQKGDQKAALENTSGLIAGSFATTFLRIGQAYIDELTFRKLSLLGANHLSLVSNTNHPSQKVH